MPLTQSKELMDYLLTEDVIINNKFKKHLSSFYNKYLSTYDTSKYRFNVGFFDGIFSSIGQEGKFDVYKMFNPNDLPFDNFGYILRKKSNNKIYIIEINNEFQRDNQAKAKIINQYRTDTRKYESSRTRSGNPSYDDTLNYLRSRLSNIFTGVDGDTLKISARKSLATTYSNVYTNKLTELGISSSHGITRVGIAINGINDQTRRVPIKEVEVDISHSNILDAIFLPGKKDSFMVDINKEVTGRSAKKYTPQAGLDVKTAFANILLYPNTDAVFNPTTALAAQCEQIQTSVKPFLPTDSVVLDEAYWHALLGGHILNYRRALDINIKSNHESGRGRYDLLITPKNKKTTAMVLELKYDEQSKNLVSNANDALNQVKKRGYIDGLSKYINLKKLMAFGLAFSRTESRIEADVNMIIPNPIESDFSDLLASKDYDAFAHNLNLCSRAIISMHDINQRNPDFLPGFIEGVLASGINKGHIDVFSPKNQEFNQFFFIVRKKGISSCNALVIYSGYDAETLYNYKIKLNTGAAGLAQYLELDDITLMEISSKNSQTKEIKAFVYPERSTSKLTESITEKLSFSVGNTKFESLLSRMTHNVLYDSDVGEFRSYTKELQKIGNFYKSSELRKEAFYHGQLLGVFSDYWSDYKIESNIEVGKGRPDIRLIPKVTKRSAKALIIELKKDNTPVLRDSAQAGLNQIKEKRYGDNLNEFGNIDRANFMSIAFSDTHVKIIHEGNQPVWHSSQSSSINPSSQGSQSLSQGSQSLSQEENSPSIKRSRLEVVEEHESISSSREVASPDVSHSESLALATPLLSCKAEAASEKGSRKEDSDDSDKEQAPNQRAVIPTIAPHTETDKTRHQEPSEKTAAQPPQASDSAEEQTHEVASEKQQISTKTPTRKTLKELHEQEMDFYAAPFEACAPALAGLIERLHSIPGPELVTLLSRHDFMKRVAARGNDTDVQEIFTSLESSMARGELSSQALVLFLKDNVIAGLEEREAALKTHFFVLLRKMLQSTETADALSSLLQEMLVQSPNLYRLEKAGAAELLDLLHEITCFSSHGYADIVPIIESTLYPLAATLKKHTQVSVNEASLMARRVLRLITDASTGQLRPKANPVLSRLLSHPSLSRKYKEALLAVLDPQTHRQYRAMLTRWDRIATAWDRLWKRKGYLTSPESDDLSLLALEKPQLLDLGHASLMQYSDDELDTIEHLLSDSFLSDIEQIEAGIEALEVTETLLKEFKVNNSFELTLYCQILSLTVLGKEQLIEDQLAQWQELHRVISHAPSTDWCETMDKRIQDKIESIEQYITHVIEEVTSEVRTQVENEFETSWNTRAQKVRDEVCAEYQFDLSIDNDDIEEMIPRKPDQKECFDFWSEIHSNLKSSIRESALDRINQSMNLSHGMNEKKNDIEVQEVVAETTAFMDENIRDRIAALAIDTVEDSEVIGGSTEKEREEYWSEAIKHRAKTALRHRWEAEENNYKEKIDKKLEGKKLETWNRRDIGQVITRKQSVEEPAVMARPEWSESGAVADIERRLEGLRIFNNEVLERDLPDVPNHSLGFFNVQKKHSKPTKLSHAPTNG